MKKTPINRQWDKLIKQETKFLKNISEKKYTKLDILLLEKVSDKLKNTINVAFAKSFILIFDKGTSVIEKSYNKDEQIIKHKINVYAYDLKQNKKHLKNFEKEINKSKIKNITISSVKGISLGFFGVGIPDIPIFIGMILKGIYEIALNYGYKYDTDVEQYFILNIISNALAYGEEQINNNIQINEFIEDFALPNNYNKIEEINIVAKALSTELLCMKFLQGIPVVGIAGGVADAIYINKILEYAKLKYKRRFLYDNINKKYKLDEE